MKYIFILFYLSIFSQFGLASSQFNLNIDTPKKQNLDLPSLELEYDFYGFDGKKQNSSVFVTPQGWEIFQIGTSAILCHAPSQSLYYRHESGEFSKVTQIENKIPVLRLDAPQTRQNISEVKCDNMKVKTYKVAHIDYCRTPHRKFGIDEKMGRICQSYWWSFKNFKDEEKISKLLDSRAMKGAGVYKGKTQISFEYKKMRRSNFSPQAKLLPNSFVAMSNCSLDVSKIQCKKLNEVHK